MTFRILSFCGGGMRGLLAAEMLDRLDEETGGGLVESADMLAGTSTGAVISALLVYGLTPGEIVAFYRDVMAEGFRREGRSPDAPALPDSQRELDLAARFPGIDPPLGEIDKKLVMTSFAVNRHEQHQPGAAGVVNSSWGMLLFNNFEGSRTTDVPLLTAMSCSSAMPGMSASLDVEIPNPAAGRTETYSCVDGAFVNHDPTLAAVALAVKAGHRLEDISVVDFGTGFMRNYMVGDTAAWGSRQWLSLPPGNRSVTPALLLNTDTPMPVLNMTLNGTSTNQAQELASLLLGDRYAYLNADFGDRYVPEDVTDPAKLDFMSRKARGVDLSTAVEVVSRHWRS